MIDTRAQRFGAAWAKFFGQPATLFCHFSFKHERRKRAIEAALAAPTARQQVQRTKKRFPTYKEFYENRVKNSRARAVTKARAQRHYDHLNLQNARLLPSIPREGEVLTLNLRRNAQPVECFEAFFSIKALLKRANGREAAAAGSPCSEADAYLFEAQKLLLQLLREPSLKRAFSTDNKNSLSRMQSPPMLRAHNLLKDLIALGVLFRGTRSDDARIDFDEDEFAFLDSHLPDLWPPPEEIDNPHFILDLNLLSELFSGHVFHARDRFRFLNEYFVMDQEYINTTFSDQLSRPISAYGEACAWDEILVDCTADMPAIRRKDSTGAVGLWLSELDGDQCVQTAERTRWPYEGRHA